MLKPKFNLDMLLWYAFRKVSKHFGFWLTYHRRPVVASRLNNWSAQCFRSSDKTAIVIQGQLILENQFTVETALSYRRLFPECIIIVSTWTNSEKSHIEVLRAADIEVVLSPPPVDPGFWNINLQIDSTYAGVKEAALRGAQWIMKCRSDQRIYAPDSIEFMKNLIRSFPYEQRFNQSQRIAICGATRMYRLYGYTDNLQFGQTEDMVKFWTPRAPNNQSTVKDILSKGNVYDRANAIYCESFLVREFFDRIGRPTQSTLKDSWEGLGESFVVVDRQMLDLFWPKYVGFQEHRGLKYNEINIHREVFFRDWLIFSKKRHLESWPKLENIVNNEQIQVTPY